MSIITFVIKSNLEHLEFPTLFFETVSSLMCEYFVYFFLETRENPTSLSGEFCPYLHCRCSTEHMLVDITPRDDTATSDYLNITPDEFIELPYIREGNRFDNWSTESSESSLRFYKWAMRNWIENECIADTINTGDEINREVEEYLRHHLVMNEVKIWREFYSESTSILMPTDCFQDNTWRIKIVSDLRFSDDIRTWEIDFESVRTSISLECLNHERKIIWFHPCDTRYKGLLIFFSQDMRKLDVLPIAEIRETHRVDRSIRKISISWFRISFTWFESSGFHDDHICLRLSDLFEFFEGRTWRTRCIHDGALWEEGHRLKMLMGYEWRFVIHAPFCLKRFLTPFEITKHVDLFTRFRINYWNCELRKLWSIFRHERDNLEQRSSTMKKWFHRK